MDILILSNADNVLNEGQKNVSSNISKRLSERQNIRHANVRKNVFKRDFWTALKQARPDIIHIFFRPSVRLLLYSKVLETISRRAKTIITALQPPLNRHLVRLLVRLLKPDLFLAASETTEKFFARSGCKVASVNCCGVDTKRFSPVDGRTRLTLREKHGIATDKFVILHVGPITKRRNLLGLIELQKNPDNLVLVVCSEASRVDGNIYKRLENAGCIVLRRYFKHVEELYQLADCYVFLGKHESGCIEVPLSVLEAMSCNIPVVTTRFGALPRLMKEGDGLFFIDDEYEIGSAMAYIKSGCMSVKVRDKVMHSSWENIVRELESVYDSLLNGSGPIQ